MKLTICLAFAIGIVTASVIATPQVEAQVNGAGTSASSLFDTVINIPTSPDIVPGQSVGGVAGETTQVNLLDGGSIGTLTLLSGTELNVLGGTLGTSSRVEAGSELNVSGGSTGTIIANQDSIVTVTGGSTGTVFANDNSTVSLLGGSPEGFQGRDDSTINVNSVNFGPFADTGAQGNSNLNISNTVIDRFFSFSSSGVLNFSSGNLGDNADVGGGTVNITGGVVGFNFNVNGDAVVNISDGDLEGISALGDSTLNIDGGTFEAIFASGGTANITDAFVGDSFAGGGGLTVSTGGVLNVSGGVFEDGLRNIFGGVLNISGGTFDRIDIDDESIANLFGTDFAIDGELLEFTDSLTIVQRGGETLTGILEDGSIFSLGLNPSTGGDATIDVVEPTATLTINRSAAVPEPGSAILAFLAVAGLAGLRRRTN